MSERHKTHNGRDVDGHFKVRQKDVEEMLESPEGAEFMQDDVRLGGAVEDVGMNAARPAQEIERRIEENRENVDRLAARNRGDEGMR